MRLSVGTPPAPVTLRRSARARRLTLRISAGSGEITLTAPPKVSAAELLRFLRAQEDWVNSRRGALPDPIVPQPGVVLPVGGVPLMLTRATGRRVHRGDAELSVPGEGEAFTARLRAVLREEARVLGLADCRRYAASLGRDFGRLSLRDPRSRWGSCSSEGNLMLSWRLILAPREVLAYVAAHEVAHLAEMNHGPRFWETLERIFPGYKAQRDWLRTNGAELHRYRI